MNTWENRKIRGVIDLLSGRYPRFLFGGAVGTILPVFHFHEVHPEGFESSLRFLSENGYRTITSEAISRFVRKNGSPGPRTVALCIDDAWESLWTIAFPLLRKYGFSAIVFAIPSRISEADTLRPTMAEGTDIHRNAHEVASLFVTWPELRSMHSSGIIDVQCHTHSHSMVFCSDRVTGFVTPRYVNQPVLDRPLVSPQGKPSYLDPADLGVPMFEQRSRMSDCLRYFDDIEARYLCMDHVKRNGGESFFSRPEWQKELRDIMKNSKGFFEPLPQREKAVLDELSESRAVLNDRLGSETVRHICFPWGIAGDIALGMLRRTGYETAFSDRLFGKRAIRAGDDPFRLMRLRNEFIFCLPGKGRRIFSMAG